MRFFGSRVHKQDSRALSSVGVLRSVFPQIVDIQNAHFCFLRNFELQDMSTQHPVHHISTSGVQTTHNTEIDRTKGKHQGRNCAEILKNTCNRSSVHSN